MIAFLYGLMVRYWPHFDITKDVKDPCPKCSGSGLDLHGYCGNCHGGYVGTTKVVYLRRFYVFRSAWVNKLLRKLHIKARLNIGNIYLHHILRSDDDPDPHDHPWNFISIVLSGGYSDEQWSWHGLQNYAEDRCARHNNGFEKVKPPTIVRRKAEHIHRVILNLDDQFREIPSWSLVFAGKYRRDWNFVTPRGPVLWWTYLGVKEPQFRADDGLE